MHLEVYSVHHYIKKKQNVKKNLLLINMQIYHYLHKLKKIQIFNIFNENLVYHDYNESYKYKKEKEIDNLLLSHDKEDVGFKNELGKHKNCKMEIIIDFEGSNFTIYCCESETIKIKIMQEKNIPILKQALTNYLLFN